MIVTENLSHPDRHVPFENSLKRWYRSASLEFAG